MIILIDNYDSFTFNIYHHLSEIGANVKVVRNDKISLSQIINLKPQAIVISPGPKTPNEAGISLDIVRNSQYNIPILGICLGHQVIAQSFGGSIVQCKEIMHGKVDTINHFGHSLFKNIERKFTATRYHSLIVDRSSVPSNMKIIAETSNKVIMGISHKRKKIFGVQFHPESIGTNKGKIIFQNFLKIIKYES